MEVFADRVEIRNPGGLPKGFDPKKFGTQSFPRNLLIASMLHRANYIEKAGTGISRIKEAIANHKKKVELDIEYSDDSNFYSIIFKKERLIETTQKIKPPADKDKFQDIFRINPQEFQDIFGINVLNTAWLIHKKPDITAVEIAEKLSVVARSSESYISQLKKKKIIERVGSKKAGHWKVIKK